MTPTEKSSLYSNLFKRPEERKIAIEERKLLKQAQKSADEFQAIVNHLRARGYDSKAEWIQNNADINQMAKRALKDFDVYSKYIVEKKKGVPEAFYSLKE